MVTERPTDFNPLRYMRCGACAHEWEVDADWLERFHAGDEPCPKCGTDCASENYPHFWVHPQDPAHDDDTVRTRYWYHSTTHAVWPDRDFDPAAQLTDECKRRMESQAGPGAVERWAARQKAKALHVGTYEAAIENMLRRMADQSDAASQFYLHRVQLQPDCVIEPGIHKELPSLMGDAELAAKCAPGVNVYRYANVFEDQSSVSLAIENGAVWRVQSIPIPLPVDAEDPGLRDAIARLLSAADRPMEQAPPEDDDDRPDFLPRHEPQTPLVSEAGDLRQEVADRLPSLRRSQLCVEFDEAGFADDPSAYPAKLIGLVRLVSYPQVVLDTLSEQPWRLI